MATEQLPIRIWFHNPRSTEAAVYAVRTYVASLQPGEVLLKLEFNNAFNMINRENMFHVVREHLPELYPFIHTHQRSFAGCSHR